MKPQLFAIKLILKAVLLTAAGLGAVTLSAPRAHGNDDDDCHRRIERAEWRLEEAIEHHGYYSRQANHERHELQEERGHCWREQRKWRDQEWREHRDYDRYRHYYDHDHRGYRDRD